MMFTLAMPLVLASASPRRRDLLAEVGVCPEIMPADGLDGFTEPTPEFNEDPKTYALRTAEAKARVVSAHRPGVTVLAADTVVVLPEPGAPVVLGKPASMEESLFMLRRLAGRTHHVLTACCLTGPTGRSADSGAVPTATTTEGFSQITEVEFMDWPEAVLRAYAETREGMDKAGAYAIQGQGAFLCAGIRGSWSNVVGLPLAQVLQRLITRDVLRHTTMK